MHTTRSLALLIAGLSIWAAVVVPAAPIAAAGATAAAAVDPLPGEGLRTTAVRRYRMAGRIRPLLFWFGRDDIGLARITWRADDDGTRGYELLVGTDPAKAPRALNKWGYVAERVNGRDGRLLALMTGTDSATYEEAAAEADPAADGDFRAIAGDVAQGTSAWKTTRVATAKAFSVYDVDAALDRIRHDTAAAARREQPLPDGARPGFLTALAELIDDGAGLPPDRPEARAVRGNAIRYLFGKDTYELSLRDAEATTLALHGRSVRAVRSNFEIRTLATNARTRFIVAFACDGQLAGVPIAAEWQPRWWLKIALTLDEPAGS